MPRELHRVDTVLARKDWQRQADSHASQIAALTAGRVERRQRHAKHPVDDFLFEYYRFSPTRMARWHPGVGVILEDADEYLDRAGYRGVNGGQDRYVHADRQCFTTGDLAHRHRHVIRGRQIVAATAERVARFQCFGLHEWAMVEGLSPNEVRHRQLRLRFTGDEIRDILDSLTVTCTHFDAFRFFTPEARGRNYRLLTRDEQLTTEQPGCLHAGMDLYRWTMIWQPITSSSLMLDCFRHAQWAREVDMRASPYDLTEWGYEPIAIETAAGRQEYVRLQKELHAESSQLRRRFLTETAQAEI